MAHRIIAAVLAAGALAAGAGFVSGGAAAQQMKIRAREFAFEPKEIQARPGEIVFTVENVGAIEHNFLIDDASGKPAAKVAVISPGDTEQVRLAARTGTYQIYCDLPGHKEAGMTAVLRVRE